MAIAGSDKIFVDVNDEINFVVEKILNAERERIILVVPQNAIIISSLVSMKILAKQLAKSKKQLILVTEDAFGLGLAERSGIIAINKVSNIMPEMWEAAQLAKENLRTKMDDTKKQLLTDRGAIQPEPAAKEVAEPETEQPEAESPAETAAEASEPEQPEPAAEADTQPETAAEAEAPVESAPEPEPEVPADAEEDVRGPINRQRLDPKVVHIAGFEIMAGGDIARLSEDKDAIIDGSGKEDTDMADESHSTKKAEKVKPRGGFTGRDWTNYTKDKGPGLSLAKLNPFKRPQPLVPGERKPVFPSSEPKSQGGSAKLKVGIFAIVLLLLLVLGAGYVLAFQFNTVEVKVSLQTQQVPVQQQISADAALTAVDKEKLIIPAKVITNSELSISASDKGSGQGQTGDKAAGLIDIWNFTGSAVTVKNGTGVENTTTNLKYIIQTSDGSDITVPACSAVTSGSCTGVVGQKQDIRIVAETFGDQYNITDTGTGVKQDFKVDGFTTDDVEGKRFKKIEGGTTTTFVSVSQDDFDRVKKSLTDTLTKQGQSKIATLVPVGYQLIDGTQQFKETESSSTPKVGDKVDDSGNFSVSLKGEETALAVSQADLQQAITILIANNQKVGSNFQINGVADAVIGDVTRTDNTATFTVSSSGNLQSSVTADTLKQNLTGKTIAEADDYLSHVDQIVSHKITYSPGIVPDALRRIPSDPNRIKIIF